MRIVVLIVVLIYIISHLISFRDQSTMSLLEFSG